MADYSKSLGEVVYRERKAQKITQAQRAELAGTTEQTIRKIEHNNSNLQMSVLFPLLRALHIDPMEIFYPEAAQETSAKKQLDMLVAQCSEAQLEAIIPIVSAAIEVFQGNLVAAIK
ncbi:MAG: helix-turn-helix transcriptional regulator [Oscillospiraceae bacterium]|nr:helix-turn-helix transcriptional regulator [Oscillospiraceae bacterium]